MPTFNPPRVKRGDPIRAVDWNAQNDEIRRLGRVRGGLGIDVRNGSGSIEATLNIPRVAFIQLTGPSGADGGYPFQYCFRLPPINVTNPGTNYTVAPTGTVSGGGGTGAIVTAILDGTGGIQRVDLTTPGTGYHYTPTITWSGGDGSDFAANFSDPAWDNWGFQYTGGDSDGAAYEARLVRDLPIDNTVYPAMVCPQSGRLLFFCRPDLVARTTMVTAYPSSANRYFAMTPQSVSPATVPGEGNAAAYTALTPVFYAYNIGGALPPQGTARVVSWVSNTWVFRYDG